MKGETGIFIIMFFILMLLVTLGGLQFMKYVTTLEDAKYNVDENGCKLDCEKFNLEFDHYDRMYGYAADTRCWCIKDGAPYRIW